MKVFYEGNEKGNWVGEGVWGVIKRKYFNYFFGGKPLFVFFTSVILEVLIVSLTLTLFHYFRCQFTILLFLRPFP